MKISFFVLFCDDTSAPHSKHFYFRTFISADKLLNERDNLLLKCCTRGTTNCTIASCALHIIEASSACDPNYIRNFHTPVRYQSKRTTLNTLVSSPSENRIRQDVNRTPLINIWNVNRDVCVCVCGENVFSSRKHHPTHCRGNTHNDTSSIGTEPSSYRKN